MSNLVYRVIAGGTHIQALRHVRSTGNGWHRYRIEGMDPMAGHEFNTRTWYSCPTPMSAVLSEMGTLAARMGLAARIARKRGADSELAARWLAQAEEAGKEHYAARHLAMMLASEAGLMRARDGVAA